MRLVQGAYNVTASAAKGVVYGTGTVAKGVARGTVAVARGVGRGTVCVFTLGSRCLTSSAPVMPGLDPGIHDFGSS